MLEKEQDVAFVEEYDKKLVSYVGQMPQTFASFGKVKYESYEQKYFGANCKHKWNSKRNCQEGIVDF